MSPLRRIATVVALGLVTALAPAAPAAAQGGDNVAVAINTKDGFDLFRLAFQVRRATTDTVDVTNAAVAYASCTDCQTVALAIQVVLISGYDSSTVTPENLAIAINQDCVLCDTLASAYQFVITAEGALRFTAEGHKRLAAIRRALLELRKSDLTGPEIQGKVDALMDELAQVLSTELVPAGNGGVQPQGSPTAAPPSSEAPPPASETPAAPGTESPSATAEPTSAPRSEEPSPTPSETVAP